MIKVMIVDDSIFIRALIKNLLASDPEQRFELVASAISGNDAMRKLRTEEIDVILLDIEMYGKNGVETLKDIMREKPTPVIMFSSLAKEHAAVTLEALAANAVDFLLKPSKDDIGKIREVLYEKIVIAAQAKNRKHLYPTSFPIIEKKYEKKEKLTHLIAIGCSTGGPPALRMIAAQLPADLSAGIVVVQHMREGGITQAMAENLDKNSHFSVSEARDGEEIVDGKMYIAPGGRYLEIYKRNGRLYNVLSNVTDPTYRFKPSVDKMLISIARLQLEQPVIAVVLTGMGDDGSKGCQTLQRIKPTIIIENEETATIYGMPKKVKERTKVDYEERIENIVPRIVEIIKKNRTIKH